jgi:hypothetical protein
MIFRPVRPIFTPYAKIFHRPLFSFFACGQKFPPDEDKICPSGKYFSSPSDFFSPRLIFFHHAGFFFHHEGEKNVGPE